MTYQVAGASLTFTESSKIYDWVDSMVQKESKAMRKSMAENGYNESAQETNAMIARVKVHTLHTIAKTKPELFTLKTNKFGEDLLNM